MRDQLSGFGSPAGVRRYVLLAGAELEEAPGDNGVMAAGPVGNAFLNPDCKVFTEVASPELSKGDLALLGPSDELVETVTVENLRAFFARRVRLEEVIVRGLAPSDAAGEVDLGVCGVHLLPLF